jgi:putative ABC transport system substrate-binding protein
MVAIARRKLLVALAGAAGWPVAARAQQRLPVIGMLLGYTPAGGEYMIAAFRQGLSDMGFIEHQTVGIEYRWAEGRYDRLPAMAADLVRRRVALILANPTAAALAAKAASATTPVIFMIAGDPVEIGLVSSLSRPDGNLTGATSYAAQLAARQLGMLHDLLPKAATIGVLVNPNARENAAPQVRELGAAAKSLGLRIVVLDVAGEGELGAAFSTLAGERADALFVTSDGFFLAQLRGPIIELAARHKLPAMYANREFVTSGGLICYTSSIFDAGRQAGIYAGRILKGARPAELPVTQPTRFQLVINLKTAVALGLTVPDKLLAIADEVIE